MNESADQKPEKRAISLYIHAPFCLRKCRYCNFYSVVGEPHRFDPFLRALANEWQLVREEEKLSDNTIEVATIYVGGGTPTALGGARLHTLLETVRDWPRWREDCEVTIEANPENVTRDLAVMLIETGYNRISLGVQSLRDDELQLLGRCHSAQQARKAVALLREAGCANLGIDLMFGLPGQSVAAWMDSLRETIALAPEHISCYLLTLEEETILHQLLHGGEMETPLDETLLQQYQETRAALLAAGYEHYEISNFARPGSRSRHNERTWMREPYYGLGPAAHSFDGQARWCNGADLEAYLNHLITEPRRPQRERYRLTREDEAKEMILLGLRRAEGLRWDALAKVTAADKMTQLRRRARFLAGTGFLEVDENGLRLAPQAYFVSNSAFVELVEAMEAVR